MGAIIKRNRVALKKPSPEELAAARLANERSDVPHEKRVRLLRQNGVVYALEVACLCGETTVVEFQYAQPAEQDPAPVDSEPTAAEPRPAEEA